MVYPKYSILIPTRNGMRYLPYTIESVLSQSFEDFELIVSVNHSKDGTLDYLKTLEDKRLKVITPPFELSMTKHFEFVITNASGEWITIIGDDDGLMPYFFREAENLIQENPKIEVITSRRAYFFWDGVNKAYGTDSIIDFTMSKRTTYKRSFSQIVATLSGIQSYFELPQLYTTGLVSKKIINSIENSSDNQFYYSMIPDAYSAAAILLEVKRYLKTEIPLFWVGSSPKSNGYSYSTVIDSKNNELEKSSTSGKMQNDIVDDFFKLSLQDNFRFNQSVPEKMLLANLGINLFFFESLISCPYTKRIWKSKLIQYIFYAGILLNLLNNKRKDSISGQEKIKVFFQEFNKLHLKLPFLYLVTIPIFVYQVISKLARFANLAYSKVLSAFFSEYKKVKFSSNDAGLFPNITAASQKALEIYEEAF